LKGAELALFEHQITVRWGDCDPAFIAYTGRIPNFALEAIDAWWKHHMNLNWFELNVDRKLGTPFVHMSLDFTAPLTPRHVLICTVELLGLGTTSITYRVRGFQDGIQCFRGKFVSVFSTSSQVETRPPPEDLKALLTPLLVPE